MFIIFNFFFLFVNLVFFYGEIRFDFRILVFLFIFSLNFVVFLVFDLGVL